jgi:hypothetical protein
MRVPTRRVAALSTAAALVAVGAVAVHPAAAVAPAAVVAGPALSIDVGKPGPTINPGVYGASFPTPAFAAAARLPLQRWGGNSTSRYDYRTDDYNTANDWYFENLRWDGGQAASSGPSALDTFVATATSDGAQAAVTVPVNGWVAKDDRVSCGFPLTSYPTQDSTDVWWTTCGNGQKNGNPLAVTLPATQTSKAFTTTDMTAMAAHLHATAPAGTPPMVYQLDNEPSLWNSTHRDVWPTAVSGANLFSRSTAAADAVIAGDPTAQVSGPGDWGWCAYFFFPKDNCAAGADRTANGGIDLGAAYLKAFHDHDVVSGHRTLAVVDEHFYPQGDGIALTTAGDAAHQALRLRSTRALWDPTYTDESWISTTGDVAHENVMLIPRMKAWVQQYYPGTGVAIGEYNFGGLESINGALAQADVLGILGREGVAWAALWGPPDTATAPGTFAFRMFRNLDGNGAAFGTTSVSATSADQGRLSVYAATRPDGTVTTVVVNKTASDLSSAVSVAGAALSPVAQVYRYSPADLAHVVTGSQAMSGTTTMTFPAQSITTLVMPLAGQTSSLSLSATPTVTTYPGRTTLTARLYTGGVLVPGARVGVYQRAAGTTAWRALASVTTDAHGRVQLPITPAYDTEYVVRDLRTAAGSFTLAPDSSVRRVDVHRGATLVASRTALVLGGAVRFSGVVSPSGRGLAVSLQHAVSGHWVTVARTTVGKGSAYAVTIKPPRGRPTYRVVAAGDTCHLGAVTRAVALRVS